MIQLYLRFLCCTSAFLSLNTLLLLFSHSCSHLLFYSFFFPGYVFLFHFLFLLRFHYVIPFWPFCFFLSSFLCGMGRILPQLHCFVVPFPTALSSCFLGEIIEDSVFVHLMYLAWWSFALTPVVNIHLEFCWLCICIHQWVCCNFFASQHCGLLQDCLFLTGFYSALNVISVSE